MILTSRSMILLASLVMILFAYAHNYIKLNHHFCVSKNIICFSKYHYEVISLNRKVQFHCKQKRKVKNDFSFCLLVLPRGLVNVRQHICHSLGEAWLPRGSIDDSQTNGVCKFPCGKKKSPCGLFDWYSQGDSNP